MSERLKNKLNSEQKIMNDNMKKLYNNSMQESIERKMNSRSDEIKFLR